MDGKAVPFQSWAVAARSLHDAICERATDRAADGRRALSPRGRIEDWRSGAQEFGFYVRALLSNSAATPVSRTTNCSMNFPLKPASGAVRPVALPSSPFPEAR
eukprot:9482277-Pyramimonas_sp.AAC.1